MSNPQEYGSEKKYLSKSYREKITGKQPSGDKVPSRDEKDRTFKKRAGPPPEKKDKKDVECDG